MDALIEDKKSLLQRFILWREKRIKEKHFILILSFLVGIFTALAAWFLKFLVEWIKEFLTENFDSTGVNWLYLVYPVVGIFLTGLFIRHIVKDDISHGVTKILYAISRRQSRIKRHNTWSSVIASAITIGFGGSVGAEAPIVLTGSAIGSNLGSAFKMEHKTLMLLVGCGAAGAVAGIFKAPIAGLVFTLEVLMIDLTMASLLPLLVSYSLVLVLGSKYLGFPTLYSTRNVSASSVLPITCLSLASIAGYALWTRRYMVDELTRDYIKLARVKGLSSREIMFKHVLRNAMVPMVQYIPQSILLTVGGSLLMERFFSVPGMGPLLTDAIQRYDLNVVQTLVILYAVLGIVGVFLGDVLMMVVDPRITLTGKEEAR